MRVLIVEDDPFVALDLESIVQDALEAMAQDAPEAQVHVAPSLADARNVMHAADFHAADFAFLDIDLMDGRVFEIARLLRERSVPFAFVSASARAEVPQALRDAPFIAKPYKVWQIAQSLLEGAPGLAVASRQ